MISFDPFWNTLKNMNIRTYSLEKDYGVSKGTIDSLKHNRSVTLHTINNLCRVLDCPVSDIIEYIKDN